MQDESDILGGRLHLSPDSFSIWSIARLFLLVIGGLGAGTVIYFSFPTLRRKLDDRYRKKLRRRYGIPDSDTRPFNVAFASVSSHKRRDAVPLKQDDGSQPASQPTPSRVLRSDGDLLRQRHRASDHHIESDSISTAIPPQMNAHHIPDTGSLMHSAQSITDATPGAFIQHRPRDRAPSSSTLSQSSPAVASAPVTSSRGKHAREDDVQTQPEKKSRLSRLDESTTSPVRDQESGDEMEVDEEVVELPKRGAKRSADVDDEGLEASRTGGRDKRARKTSSEKPPERPRQETVHEDMDADEVKGLRRSHRGKKRDRAEAGSTFDGDDSFTFEDEVDELDKPHRHRRRRTVSQKKPDATTRGQKRGRDMESHDSDEDSDRPKRRDTRKRRGKRGSEVGDIPFDAPLSNDPLCKGRRIGEEWEANGVHFKVGPNGQRLRQELVKKARSRFPMPSDSQHPDRRTNIDVYVETWLSEEEYKAAKERHELAWQDPGSEPPTPGDVSDSPAGKGLLWSSTMSQRDSPAPQRGPFRQSIATNVGLRINPFPQSQVGPGRRVSSALHTQTPVPPVPDSPKVQSSKTYSKWEKQDLEAAAMAKIREKAQLDAAEAKKAESLQSAQRPAGIPTFSAPTPPFTLGKATEQSAQAEAKSTTTPISFGVPPPSATSTSTTSSLNVPQASLAPPSSAPAAMEAPKAPASFGFPAAAATQNKLPTFSGGSSSFTTSSSNQGQSPLPAAAAPSLGAQQGSQQQSSKTPAPVSTGSFSFGTKPASATAMGSGPAFNAPSTAGAGSQPPSAVTTSDAPKRTFSFGVPSGGFGPSQVHAKADQDKSGQPVASGNSLLSRIGGTAPSSDSQPSTASTGSMPTLSFGKPSTPSSGAAASNGSSGTAFTMPPSSSSSTASSNANASGTPKFNFGFSSKPANPTPASAPASSSTQSSGGSADTAKPSFGFGAPTQPAPATTSSAQPSFGFGAPSQSSSSGAFGGGANAFSAPATASTTPKSAFGFGTQNASTTSSAFPTTPANSSASGSIFGGAASNATTKPSDSSKATFGFSSGPASTSNTTPIFGVSGSGASNSTTPAPSNAPKPSFSFGTSSMPTPAGANGTTPTTNAGETQSKPAFSFNFGQAPSSTTTNTPTAFGAQPASSPFGKPSQPAPNALNFGAPSSSSSGAFGFGSSTTNQNQKQ